MIVGLFRLGVAQSLERSVERGQRFDQAVRLRGDLGQVGVEAAAAARADVQSAARREVA